MNNPRLFLAPMAGITDYAFRRICAKCGADVGVSEMVSAKAMFYGDQKSKKIADISRDILPMSVQIFGSDPLIMAYAASQIEKNSSVKPNSIDINMGCPMPKIVNNGDGSALMRNPQRVAEIVTAVCSYVDIPVTVKIRSGWDEISVNAVEIARLCEQNGASAVAVHGRTRKQLYSGSADWDVIKSVKENVSIDVIGNGDIIDGSSAQRMLKHTKCDSLMIGRAALGDPWIFARIKAHFNNQEFIEPTWDEKKELIKEHLEYMREDKGERIAALEARKHISWYLKGVENACSIRNEVNRTESIDNMLRLIDL